MRSMRALRVSSSLEFSEAGGKLRQQQHCNEASHTDVDLSGHSQGTLTGGCIDGSVQGGRKLSPSQTSIKDLEVSDASAARVCNRAMLRCRVPTTATLTLTAAPMTLNPDPEAPGFAGCGAVCLVDPSSDVRVMQALRCRNSTDAPQESLSLGEATYLPDQGLRTCQTRRASAAASYRLTIVIHLYRSPNLVSHDDADAGGDAADG